jgi:hypothetical protein
LGVIGYYEIVLFFEWADGVEKDPAFGERGLNSQNLKIKSPTRFVVVWGF